MKVLTRHLELYRTTRDRIGEKALNQMSVIEREAEFKATLFESEDLHSGCTSSENETKVQKKIPEDLLFKFSLHFLDFFTLF